MPAATPGDWLPLTSPLSQGVGSLNARCFSPLSFTLQRYEKKLKPPNFSATFFNKIILKISVVISS